MTSATRKQIPTIFWLLVVLALGSSLILMLTPTSREFSWTGFIIASGLIGLLSLSPIPVGGRDAILAHSVSLAIALYYSPHEAVPSLFTGLLVGEIGRTLIEDRQVRFNRWQANLDSFVSSYCQHTFSLALSLYAFQWAGGSIPLGAAGSTPVLRYVFLGVAFILPFLATQWLQEFGKNRTNLSVTEAFTFIVVIGFLPIPYSLITAEAAAALGETALVILGGGPAVIAPIVRGLLVAERDLERRLNELSTLGEVSQAMRTSLNLEAILHTIYLQVAHLLEVRNFFVALYDADQETLLYPLAIKGGNRQTWASRPLSDRLTDRVILTGEPLLIPKNAPRVLREMGMPELENAPEAWLGVPLQVPDRTLGCLGVFHLDPPGTFNPEEMELLKTIAGQASVAIENAMLYDQTRRRARALASLNEISTQMSSSLDPEQTLRMVARSLIRVIEGQAAAIYLVDDDGAQLELVQSTGLPEDFKASSAILPLSALELTEAFHSGKPKLINRDGSAPLSGEEPAVLPETTFSTRLDLPLITPSGPLGIASVFFATPTSLTGERLELLETFVAQSAIAVANAKAHAATDQALKRQVDQLSRLETIGRDMVSTLDPEDLFEVILDSALEATGAPIGYLALATSNSIELRLVAHHGFHPQDKFLSQEFPAEQLGLSGKAFLEGQTIVADDVRQLPEHVDWTQGDTGSLLAVPISRWGRTLGVLAVEKEASNDLSPEEPRFLAQVASYAAVAITNANLYQQLEDNLREQSLLFQASAQISTSMDLKSVAYAVADSLLMSIDASAAAVYSLHHRSKDLIKLAEVIKEGLPAANFKQVLQADLNSLEEAVSTGAPSHYELNSEEDSFSVMAIPLQVGAQSIGAIQVVFAAPHTISEAELRTSQTIASQAAVAIQNTDLFRRIRESRDRLDAVINSTKEGILMVDQDGKVLLVNRPFERLLEVEADKLVGNGLLTAATKLAEKLQLPTDPGTQNSVPLLSTLEGETSPTTIQMESPQSRVLERMVRTVLDTAGNRIGWLVILRDVSEERELEEAREQLVEMIVHDLRSPLSTIKGAISLLERSLPEEKRSEVTTQALTVSDRAVNQMLGLVNSLLDLARLQNDPLEVKSKPVDLETMLKLLAETYIPEANEAGIILNLDLPEELPTIQADEDKLRRVISNLLDNAIKFTPDGGTIELSAEANGDRALLLAVADDGPGVPAEMRDRIFERFSQVPGMAGRRRGTGLGLAFAKLAIEAHGGKIWVESNNGQGARFLIRLPYNPAD